MLRRPPRSKRTHTPSPDTTLFRSWGKTDAAPNPVGTVRELCSGREPGGQEAKRLGRRRARGLEFLQPLPMAAALGQDLPDVEALLAQLLEHGLQLQHAGMPAGAVFAQRAEVRGSEAVAVQKPGKT